jgi:hypothetical protein
MAEQQPVASTDADGESLDAKWRSFVEGLTPAERALLEERLAGADGDVQGFWIRPRPVGAGDGDLGNTARPAPLPGPRPGSSAQPR